MNKQLTLNQAKSKATKEELRRIYRNLEAPSDIRVSWEGQE